MRLVGGLVGPHRDAGIHQGRCRPPMDKSEWIYTGALSDALTTWDGQGSSGADCYPPTDKS